MQEVFVSSSIKAEYIEHMGNDLTVVNAARVSFGKFKNKLDEGDEKLLTYLAKHKHFTPFEHCQLSVLISCPLYIRSQIHRHRTFSYNEISRRYTDENIEFFVPDNLRHQHTKSKQCSNGIIDDENLQSAYLLAIKEHHIDALNLYQALLDAGIAREQARGVLPQNLMTQFWMSGNLRNWAQFLALRLDGHAQAEAQSIAQNVANIIKDKFPKAGKALLDNL